MPNDEPTPVIFFQETLNSERKYGRLSRYSIIDDHTYLLSFEAFGSGTPSDIVIRYYDDFDFEVSTSNRFMRRELGKEN